MSKIRKMKIKKMKITQYNSNEVNFSISLNKLAFSDFTCAPAFTCSTK